MSAVFTGQKEGYDERQGPVVSADARRMTQINTRISAVLKERGEAGFAAANMTSSEAIRLLYEFAAAHTQQPEALRSALSLDDEAHAEREVARRRRIEGFAQAGQLVPSFLEEAGAVQVDPSLANAPYKRLKELAYAERYGIEV